jgi:hypothetical protein
MDKIKAIHKMCAEHNDFDTFAHFYFEKFKTAGKNVFGAQFEINMSLK